MYAAEITYGTVCPATPCVNSWLVIAVYVSSNVPRHNVFLWQVNYSESRDGRGVTTAERCCRFALSRDDGRDFTVTSPYKRRSSLRDGPQPVPVFT